jgi:hypothetical protein
MALIIIYSNSVTTFTINLTTQNTVINGCLSVQNAGAILLRLTSETQEAIEEVIKNPKYAKRSPHLP